MLSREPHAVPDALLERARAHGPIRVAVAGAKGTAVLEALAEARELGLVEPLLVGLPEAGLEALEAAGLDPDKVKSFEVEDEAAAIAGAVALVRQEEAEVLMKGKVHSDAFVRAVLDKAHGLRGPRRLTHCFHMSFPDSEESLVITDAAVNVAPDMKVLLDILGNAVDLMATLEEPEPRVAVLSASEVVSAAMPSSQQAADLVALARPRFRQAAIDGPMALDLAVAPSAAEIKAIESEVAGRAQVLVAPNIETGNALFKALVYFRSATAAGLVLGARAPVILTSRADPPEARLASLALAAIAAGEGK